MGSGRLLTTASADYDADRPATLRGRERTVQQSQAEIPSIQSLQCRPAVTLGGMGGRHLTSCGPRCARATDTSQEHHRGCLF
jgi:hypothetical protein